MKLEMCPLRLEVTIMVCLIERKGVIDMLYSYGTHPIERGYHIDPEEPMVS
jgi:hypothetical protein